MNATLLEEYGFKLNTNCSDKSIYLYDVEYVPEDTVCPVYIGRWKACIEQESRRLKLDFFLFRHDRQSALSTAKYPYARSFAGITYDRMNRDSLDFQIRRMDRDLSLALGLTRIA